MSKQGTIGAFKANITRSQLEAKVLEQEAAEYRRRAEEFALKAKQLRESAERTRQRMEEFLRGTPAQN